MELVRRVVVPDNLPVIVDAVRFRKRVRVDDCELTCLPEEADLVDGITVQTAISHNHTGIVYAVSKRCVAVGVIDGSECTAVINEAERNGRICVIAGDLAAVVDGMGSRLYFRSRIIDRAEGAVIVEKAANPARTVDSGDLIAVVDPPATGVAVGSGIVEGRENAIRIGEAVRLCNAHFNRSRDYAGVVNPLRKGGTCRIVNGGVDATGVEETVIVPVLRVQVIAHDGAVIVDGLGNGCICVRVVDVHERIVAVLGEDTGGQQQAESQEYEVREVEITHFGKGHPITFRHI